jgi:hypothetical protein
MRSSFRISTKIGTTRYPSMNIKRSRNTRRRTRTGPAPSRPYLCRTTVDAFRPQRVSIRGHRRYP